MSKFFTKENEDEVTHQPQIRVAKSAYRKIVFKKVVSVLGYTVVGVLVLYLCFAATIMRVVPTTSGAGLVPVKENTFPGSNIPTGETILVDTVNEQNSEYLDRLRQAFVPSKTATVVEVVAGPYGSFKWLESGIITVDGELTKAYMSEKPMKSEDEPKEKLLNEYLAVCVSGDCNPDEAIIVSADNVYGLTLTEHSSETTD